MEQPPPLQVSPAQSVTAAPTNRPAAPTQPRPLVQQSNQVVKRLALLGVQQKQLENPDLRREVVKEPSITFLAFIVDRLLDHLLTSVCHSQGMADIDELVDTICQQMDEPDAATDLNERLLEMSDHF